MSLRHKALAAVLVLVIALTGGLVIYVSRLYEEAERTRIFQDLRRDAAHIQGVLKAAREQTESGLRTAILSSELQDAFSRNLKLTPENLKPFMTEWRRPANADITIVAFEEPVAQDRGAQILYKLEGDELVIVGIGSRSPLPEFQRNALLESDDFHRMLTPCFQYAFDHTEIQNPATDIQLTSGVLAAGGTVYLVVVVPIYEDLQEWTVAGVAAVLTELSDAWADANRVETPEDGDNPVRQIIFSGTSIAAQTIGDANTARQLLAAKPDRTGETYEVTAPWLGHSERFIGLVTHFKPAVNSGKNVPGFVAVKSLDRALGPLRSLQTRVLIAGTILAIVGAFGAYATTLIVIRKLHRLQEATLRVREGDFETRVRIKGSDEIASLGNAFNDMVIGLKALGTYTDPHLAKQLLGDPSALTGTGERQEGTILFTDLIGFTTLTEASEPEPLIAQLNEYLTMMTQVIRDTGGYLDKFIGDSVMAYWGPPFIQENDYAERACHSALTSIAKLKDLQTIWEAEGRAPFHQRIGIATGEVIVGNVGSEMKKNFTVIGDKVNLASRLEQANKDHGTTILVDGRTHDLAKDAFEWRHVATIEVKGRQEPVRAYEVTAEARAPTS